jgi:glycosyltransferase involved in cell wall biosynthesis
MASYIIAASYGSNPVWHYFSGLGQELVDRGHSVRLIVDQQRTDVESRSGNPRLYTWPSRRPTHFRDARFLRNLIREEKPSAILANFGSVNVSTLIGFVSRVPVRIAWYHSVTEAGRMDYAVPHWKRRAYDLRKAAVYRLTSHVVAVGEVALEDARATYGISSEKSRSLPLLLQDPFRSGRPRDPARIVCVGRLYPSKGQATLIRALPEVRQAVPEVTAEFIGEVGPALDDYVRLAESLGVADRCRFVGRLELDEVYERVSGAAVAVVTSHFDAFGLAAVEAQALATPLVATDVGGMKETVADGESGYLVPPGDPSVLADRLIPLLRDPGLRDRVGRLGRQRFLDLYSIRRIGTHADWLEETVRRATAAG